MKIGMIRPVLARPSPCACYDLRMYAKRVRIVTPFPSMEETAKKLGATKADVERIKKLVAEVVYGSKKASSRRPAGAAGRKRVRSSR